MPKLLTNSDKPTEINHQLVAPISSTDPFSTFQLIALVLQFWLSLIAPLTLFPHSVKKLKTDFTLSVQHQTAYKVKDQLLRMEPRLTFFLKQRCHVCFQISANILVATIGTTSPIQTKQQITFSFKIDHPFQIRYKLFIGPFPLVPSLWPRFGHVQTQKKYQV